MRNRYVLYLSRLARAKGVDDLIAGFTDSAACQDLTLVIAGNGPEAPHLRELAAASSAADRIRFLDDVDDDEKPHLMAGCATFVLPSKPRPEFVETFGIALVEKMLALQKERQSVRREDDLDRVRNLEREIAQVDAEIDQRVYALYGLTEDEVKVVEAT